MRLFSSQVAGEPESCVSFCFKGRKVAQLAKPTLRRPMPILGFWQERIALADRTYAEAEEFRVGVSCRPVDRGSAFGAKGLDAFVAARSRLHVGFGDSGEESETAFNRRNNNPEGRARKRLAIGAVTNLDRVRIDFRFKG
jgi:hypothetical protein